MDAIDVSASPAWAIHAAPHRGSVVSWAARAYVASASDMAKSAGAMAQRASGGSGRTGGTPSPFADGDTSMLASAATTTGIDVRMAFVSFAPRRQVRIGRDEYFRCGIASTRRPRE
jgi:hypothetical protein